MSVCIEIVYVEPMPSINNKIQRRKKLLSDTCTAHAFVPTIRNEINEKSQCACCSVCSSLLHYCLLNSSRHARRWALQMYRMVVAKVDTSAGGTKKTLPSDISLMLLFLLCVSHYGRRSLSLLSFSLSSLSSSLSSSLLSI